ncbi:MAG TPA: universal stress protein [Candidatus Eremiobacteraceae bacterium]|nr:universal stress protein [Candidatus Eremiobacteraceae bacterium]
MSMFKMILVPVDGSAPSDAAVALAVRLARDQDAKVVFTHVCEVAKIAAMMSAPAVSIDPSYALEAEREAGEAALQDAVDRAKGGGIDANSCIEEGSCVDTILTVARQHKADLIVIGSHGRSGLARALLGSIAEGVLRHSKVPVLVTRASETVTVGQREMWGFSVT